MKKGCSLLLCVILLLGLLGGPRGLTASAEEGAGLSERAGAQAFAASMACWFSGYDLETNPNDSLLLWDMAGWYAAWLYRAEGWDLVSAEQAEDFLRAVGYTGVLEPPEGWEEYGVVRRLRSSDGSESFDFTQHKLEIDAMLGINTEFVLAGEDADTLRTKVVYHYDNGETNAWDYALRFTENPDSGSAFPYRLTAARFVPAEVEVDPLLGFGMEELLAANRLQNVLALYPCVRAYNPQFGPDYSTWIFPSGDGLALIYKSEGSASGQLRGCVFNYEERLDGSMLASIGEMNEDAGSWEKLDGYLNGYLADLLSMRLDYVSGDLIWMECSYRGGVRERLAVDRGTLVLRELVIYYAEDYPPAVTVFDYQEPVPAFPFLKSWEGEMRTVTLVWEDFPNGIQRIRTEKVEIPADWEYLPYEGRWGEYTIYRNREYTELYTYPGPGVDYTLYLTTAKG